MRLFVMRWKWKMMWTKNWNFKATCFQLITMAHAAKESTNWNIGYSLDFFLNFILYENQCFCCVYMCCKFVCSLIFLSYILLSKCNFPFDNDFNVCSDNFKQKSALISWHQNFWFRKYTEIKVKIQHAWMALFSYMFLLSIVLICFRFCFGKHKHTRSKLLFQLELITLSQVNVVQHTHFVSNYFLFLINFFVSNYFLFSTIFNLRGKKVFMPSRCWYWNSFHFCLRAGRAKVHIAHGNMTVLQFGWAWYRKEYCCEPYSLIYCNELQYPWYFTAIPLSCLLGAQLTFIEILVSVAHSSVCT